MLDNHTLYMVIIMSAVTVALRFLPFLVFGKNRQTPYYIIYLGKVLPFAIMGMLVVFALKETKITAYPYGIPELIACLTVAGLQIWKHNSLISIICGTILYMILVQFIFIS